MRQQHHADCIRKHDARGLVPRELGIQVAAKGDIERGGRTKITHRQVHENHFVHGFLLYLGHGLRYFLDGKLVATISLNVKRHCAEIN
jgi:hypothetical protein